MITIYGIPNCDTVQKAIKWLEAKKVKYTFHNYREHGIDKATLETWLKHLPIDKLVNTRSTTYRELGDEARAAITDKKKAITLMMTHNSVIKRPVWDMGDGRYLLGFDVKTQAELGA
jgi:arsenate reductase